MATISRSLPASRPSPMTGLNTPPFVDLVSQLHVANDLLSWLTSGTPGLGILTGDRGSGKSRLLEQIVLALAEDEDRLIGVIPGDGGKHSDAAFLKQAIGAFGNPPTGRTGIELIAEFRQRLTNHNHEVSPAVLLVDDAAFGGSRLEILRSMLSADAADSSVAAARMQIVLFGPPELADRIARRQQLSTLVGFRGTMPDLPETDLQRVIQNWYQHTGVMAPGLPRLTPEGESAIELAAAGNPGRALAIANSAVQESRRLGGIDIGRILVHSVTHHDALSAGRRARQAHSKGEGPTPTIVQQSMTLPGLENGPNPGRDRSDET